MNELVLEYDKDFYSWLVGNTELLRQGRFFEIDAEHIAEELDGMSKSQQHALINRLVVLLAHLLKWKYQPLKRSSSWRGTIIEQRDRIEQILESSPSLRYRIEEKLSKAYPKAIRIASNDTGFPENVFPVTCPFTFEEAADNDFYPEPD